jgi:hypothetical protein
VFFLRDWAEARLNFADLAITLRLFKTFMGKVARRSTV